MDMGGLILIRARGMRLGLREADVVRTAVSGGVHALPMAPEYFRGVAAVDGRTTGLFDLGACLGLGAVARRVEPSAVVVMLESEARVSGFAIEAEEGRVEGAEVMSLPVALRSDVIAECAIVDGVPVPVVEARVLFGRVEAGHPYGGLALGPPAEHPGVGGECRHFTVAGEQFCLPADAVTGEGRMGGPTVALPGLPRFVRGVALHEGRLVGVMDPAVLLGLPAVVEGDECYMLGDMAFIVDEDHGAIGGRPVVELPPLARSSHMHHALMDGREVVPVLNAENLMAAPMGYDCTGDYQGRSAVVDAYGREAISITEFSVMGERCAVPGDQATALMGMLPYRSIPGRHSIMLGVAAYEGEALPVLDVALCFGRLSPVGQETELVLIENGPFRALVLAEGTRRDVPLPVAEQLPMPISQAFRYIYGTYSDEGRIRLILNVKTLTVHYDEALVGPLVESIAPRWVAPEVREVAPEPEPEVAPEPEPVDVAVSMNGAEQGRASVFVESGEVYMSADDLAGMEVSLSDGIPALEAGGREFVNLGAMDGVEYEYDEAGASLGLSVDASLLPVPEPEPEVEPEPVVEALDLTVSMNGEDRGMVRAVRVDREMHLGAAAFAGLGITLPEGMEVVEAGGESVYSLDRIGGVEYEYDEAGASLGLSVDASLLPVPEPEPEIEPEPEVEPGPVVEALDLTVSMNGEDRGMVRAVRVDREMHLGADAFAGLGISLPEGVEVVEAGGEAVYSLDRIGGVEYEYDEAGGSLGLSVDASLLPVPEPEPEVEPEPEPEPEIEPVEVAVFLNGQTRGGRHVMLLDGRVYMAGEDFGRLGITLPEGAEPIEIGGLEHYDLGNLAGIEHEFNEDIERLDLSVDASLLPVPEVKAEPEDDEDDWRERLDRLRKEMADEGAQRRRKAIITALVILLILVALTLVYCTDVFRQEAYTPKPVSLATPETVVTPEPLVEPKPEPEIVVMSEPEPEPEPVVVPVPEPETVGIPVPEIHPEVIIISPVVTKEVKYRVKRGDTLWHITRRYKGNPFLYPTVAEANRIRNPHRIYPGQIIRIVPETPDAQQR